MADGVIEPIIPVSLAEKVKSIYASRELPILRKQRLRKNRIYYGTQLLRCEACGSAMNSDKSGARKLSYYACHGHRKLHSCNHGKWYRVDIVDKGILDSLSKRILTEKTVEGWVDFIFKRAGELNSRLCNKAELRRLASLRDECDQRLGRLKEAIASGTIPYNSLADKIREEEGKKAEITDYLDFAHSLGQLDLARPREEDIRLLVMNLRGILEMGDELKVKRLINDVVEKITVSPEGRITVYYDKNSLVKGLNFPDQVLYAVSREREIVGACTGEPRSRSAPSKQPHWNQCGCFYCLFRNRKRLRHY